jgi:hypothetical protein
MPDESATTGEAFLDGQALRLLRAFFRISDEETRELVIKLAEAAERGLPIADTAPGSAMKSLSGEGNVVQMPPRRNPFR